jgi:acetyl esterase/lipase
LAEERNGDVRPSSSYLLYNPDDPLMPTTTQLLRFAFLVPSVFLLQLRGEDSLRFAQPEVRLWSDAELGTTEGGPEKWNPSTDGFHRITNIHKPSMFVFLPPKEKANGAAVVICPGGGHRYLVMDLEGSLVAERLNAMGIAAFVVKSRLSRAVGSKYTTDVHSLQDAQRAIRTIRSRAREWNVDPGRVGIMGFSAGGEIAALAATRESDSEARPDFAVLVYSALPKEITLDKTTTPPMFLIVAGDDALAVRMADLYQKLKSAGVPSELHIYERGGHGFGMTGRTPEFRQWPVARWPDALQQWLADRKLLTPTK